MRLTPQRVSATTNAVLISCYQRDALSFGGAAHPTTEPHVLGFRVED